MLHRRRTYLRSVRVSDSLGVDPVFGLLVLRVLDLSWWVDGWVKVFEETSGLFAVSVDKDLVGAVGARVDL